MKLKNIILSSTLILGLTQVSNAQTAAGIKNSAHDFSSAAWNNAAPINVALQGQICLPCHAPHGNQTTYTLGLKAPLWSHRLSLANYTTYTGTNMQAVIGQPDGTSKLCLSCHDGTVALENFKSYSTGVNFISAANNVGSDLSNDHPISFVYDAALAAADGKLYDPSTQTSGLTPSGTIHADMLEEGKVQCKSCHDPHNSVGGKFLLRKSNIGSALCMTCHNK